MLASSMSRKVSSRQTCKSEWLNCPICILSHDLSCFRYPKSHPFATSLGGSDNIISFHTERYGVRPLIVQGAGAGAAVTAMGVLSDLLKLV